jgi:hypothetical protein
VQSLFPTSGSRLCDVWMPHVVSCHCASPALEGDLPTLQPLVQPLSVFAGLWSRVPILPLSAAEIGTVLTR